MARLRGGETRFEAYLDAIAAVLGHPDRGPPMRAYCRALLLPSGRKSVELMAARLGSNRVRALHQSMHHVVAKAAWDDAAVLAVVRRQVIPQMAQSGALRYFTVNDIICQKRGIHSVGVAKQPGNSSSAPENCQVSVTLWASNELASLPLALRLALPQAWADDPARRRAAGVPPAIRFETRAAIALQQLREAAHEIRDGVVLGAPAYGETTEFRSGVEALGLRYMLTARPETCLWPVAPHRERPGPPRRGSSLMRPAEAARTLAWRLPVRAWRTIAMRDGGRAGTASRFAAIRVRLPTPATSWLADAERWLLAEWPPDSGEATRFWLSDLPAHLPLKSLVWTAKSVGRVTTECQELKQRFGLAHYEGRGWRGHHHHATLCMAAYGFMVAERCAFPATQRYVPSLAAESPRLPGIDARRLG